MCFRSMVPRVALAGALICGAGCDPLGAVIVRQRLQPVPPPECLAPAVAAAPHVSAVNVGKQLAPTHFQLGVRDSLRKDGHTPGVEFLLETGPDSITRATVRFQWLGTSATYPQAWRDRWTAIGLEVVEAVRRACAPGTPVAPECTDLGRTHEQSRQCAPAT